MSNTTITTAKQEEIVNTLVQNFDLNPDRILFINPRDPNEPWIAPDELQSIARQTESLTQISVTHDKFIPETNQVVYAATVVSRNGLTFSQTGVAVRGENPNGVEIDADVLASGRALSAALRAAGIHPYKSGSVVDIGVVRQQVEAKKDEQAVQTESRNNSLRRLHTLAEQKGLKIGRNDTAYRMWLYREFGTSSAATFDSEKMALAINRLENYENEFANLPQELATDVAA